MSARRWQFARFDTQSTFVLKYLPAADKPEMFGELTSLSIGEIIDESEHELATAWMIEEPKLRTSLRKVVGAAVIIENHGVPNEHCNSENLFEFFWWWPGRHEKHGFNEGQKGGGDLEVLHGAMVACVTRRRRER